MGKREWCGKREEELLKEFRVEKSDSDEVSVPLFFFLSFSWTRCWLPVLCLLNLSYLRERESKREKKFIHLRICRTKKIRRFLACSPWIFIRWLFSTTRLNFFEIQSKNVKRYVYMYIYS